MSQPCSRANSSATNLRELERGSHIRLQLIEQLVVPVFQREATLKDIRCQVEQFSFALLSPLYHLQQCAKVQRRVDAKTLQSQGTLLSPTQPFANRSVSATSSRTTPHRFCDSFASASSQPVSERRHKGWRWS